MLPEEDNLCSCYWPEKILLLPDSPAVIDKESAEFRWKNTDNEGYIIFKFCPKCGYEMPKYARDLVDPGIPREEYLNLQNTLKNINNIEGLIKIYGMPDGEYTQISYSRKSETATIFIEKNFRNKTRVYLSPLTTTEEKEK